MFSFKYYDGIKEAQAKSRKNPTRDTNFDFDRLGHRGWLGRLIAPIIERLFRLAFLLLREFWPNFRWGRLVLVSRDADVRDALANSEAFEVPYGLEMMELSGGANFVLGLEDAPHCAQWAQIDDAIHRGDADWLSEESGRLARLLVEGSAGRIDVMGDLITRVATETCCRYFGLKVDDPDAFAEWTMAISSLLFADPAGNAVTRQTALAGAERVRAIARRAIVRAGKGNDTTIIGRLVAKNVPSETIVGIVVGMVTGFVPTNTLGAGKMLEELLRRPLALEGAKAAARCGDMKTLQAYLLEAGRLNPALALGQWRYARKTGRIAAGTSRSFTVKQGSVLLISTMSALRDRRAVHQPGRFLVDREEGSSELIFGACGHRCMGKHLALAQITAVFQVLLSLDKLEVCADRYGRIDWVGPFPRRLDMQFKPKLAPATQTMLTICAPIAPQERTAVEAKVKELGNPAREEVATALQETKIVHFASMTVIECGGADDPAPHILLELNVDGEAEEAIAIVAQRTGAWLQPIFGHVPNFGSLPLARILSRHRLDLRATPWGTTGLDFNGIEEFSVADIETQASLREFTRDALDLYLQDHAGFGNRAMQAVDFVRDLIWHDGPHDGAGGDSDLARDVAKLRARGKDFRDFLIRPNRRRPLVSQWKERTGNQAFGAFLQSRMFRWTLVSLLVLDLVVSAVVFGSISSRYLIGVLGGILLAVVGGLLATLLALAAIVGLFAAFLRRHEIADRPDDSDPQLDQSRKIAASEDHPGYRQNHITAVTQMKTGWFRRVTLALALWGIGKLKQFWFRPGFVLNMGTIHYAKWFRSPGQGKLVFLANYDGSWESYLEDFITKAHPGQSAAWSHGVGFPRTRFLIYDGARDGDRFKRWVRRQQVPTQFWYSRFPQLTTDQIRDNAVIHDGLMRANTNSAARAWLDCFGTTPRPDFTIETAEVQSLVFKGFATLPFCAYAILTFPDKERWKDWLPRCRDWLQCLVPSNPLYGDRELQVTLGDRQYQEGGDEAARGLRPGPNTVRKSATFVAFSSAGLSKLGPAKIEHHECWLDSFPSIYNLGMAARSNVLGDAGTSAPQRWEWDDRKADAVLIVYAETEAECDRLVGLHRDRLGGQDGALVTKVIQAGPTADKMAEWHALCAEPRARAPARPSIDFEHFGFRDGISQPIIRGTQRFVKNKSPRDIVEAGEFILGYRNNQGFFPPSAMVEAETDPERRLANAADSIPSRFPDFAPANLLDMRDFGRNGTFIVLRQLVQDVAGFHKFTEDKAVELESYRGLPEIVGGKVTAKWVAAKMVGRWQNGTPLIDRSPTDPTRRRHTGEEPDNDFSFGVDDPQGLQCPLGAHIRRANPRDSLDPGSELQQQITNRHRLLRRGRSYEQPDGEKGLLFICLCADLGRQFELVQQSWIGSPSFHGLVAEPDPLVATATPGQPRDFTIPTASGSIRLQNMESFVSVKAGGYFFLPSRSAIQYLAHVAERRADGVLQPAANASGAGPPDADGGVASRDGADRGGGAGCGHAASLGQR